MNKYRKVKLYGTTAADGSLTVTGGNHVLGELVAVEWIDGTGDDGAALTLSFTSDDSGVSHNLLVVTMASNVDKIYYPRTLQHLDTDGSNLTTHTAPIINGVLKMVIASGGNAKAQGCIVHYKVG